MTRQKSAPYTNVETLQTTLSPLEEKVIRMRHGLQAPQSLHLEQIGQENPALAAQLRAIEIRALATVGVRSSEKKRKIIRALRKHSRTEKKS